MTLQSPTQLHPRSQRLEGRCTPETTPERVGSSARGWLTRAVLRLVLDGLVGGLVDQGGRAPPEGAKPQVREGGWWVVEDHTLRGGDQPTTPSPDPRIASRRSRFGNDNGQPEESRRDPRNRRRGTPKPGDADRPHQPQMSRRQRPASTGHRTRRRSSRLPASLAPGVEPLGVAEVERPGKLAQVVLADRIPE